MKRNINITFCYLLLLLLNNKFSKFPPKIRNSPWDIVEQNFESQVFPEYMFFGRERNETSSWRHLWQPFDFNNTEAFAKEMAVFNFYGSQNLRSCCCSWTLHSTSFCYVDCHRWRHVEVTRAFPEQFPKIRHFIFANKWQKQTSISRRTWWILRWNFAQFFLTAYIFHMKTCHGYIAFTFKHVQCE